MLKVDVKRLLERLGPRCLDALQAAVGTAVAGSHGEVRPEHFLSALLEDEQSDLWAVIRECKLDGEVLQHQLEAVLSGFARDSKERPAMSEELALLLQDAWLIASVDFKEQRIRSAALILALLEGYQEMIRGLNLADVRPERLRSAMDRIRAMSGENVESEAGEESGGAARFCVNYMDRIQAGEVDPVFGREDVYRRIIDILARRRKNNPILVGDAGVGKTAVVEGLALRIVQEPESVPAFLRDVVIMGLDIGLMEAGAGLKGEFEERLKSVIDDIRSVSERVILFIDEAHTLIGAGGAEGRGDAANLLKPVLARGEVRTIAATTWKEYKRYFERDAALSRRFQLVTVPEPNIEDTVAILRGLKDRYEKDHGVTIRDDAIEAAAELSSRYISGRFQPDKAVDLLDTSAARVRINLTGRPDFLEEQERFIRDMTRRSDALMRDKLHGRDVPDKDIKALQEGIGKLKQELEPLSERWKKEQECARRLQSIREMLADGLANGHTPERLTVRAKACLEELKAIQGGSPLVPHEVDPEVVAKVVSEWTGIPLGKVQREEADAMLNLGENLRHRIKGQDHAMELIARTLAAAKSGLKGSDHPMGVFLLAGPSGVGKTETALALTDILLGDESSLICLSMNEFQERHTVSRLIGSPPGYVGYGEGGLLTDAVRRKPYSVVLLDEADKAHPEVMNLFLQVFDKGWLADGEGRSVDFRNTVMVLTSTVGVEELEEELRDHSAGPVEDMVQAMRIALNTRFAPSLLSRLSVVPFYPLTEWALREIVSLKLDRLAAHVLENNKTLLTYADDVTDRIVDRARGAGGGARIIDHVLRSLVLPVLSEGFLDRMARKGSPKSAVLSIDQDGDFAVDFDEGVRGK